MTARHARIYDAVAFVTAVIVISLDQWTKSLVVSHLGPPGYGPTVPLIQPYLVLYYIRNQGAAFSTFDTNTPLLIVLIAVAIAVIGYLYWHMLNSGTLLYKLIFGLIIGGAAGNLLDRFTRGSVVDFIWFRIPQIGFNFAVFNLADSAISIGVVLLFITLALGALRPKPQTTEEMAETSSPASTSSSPLREHDAQS